ncbi:SCO2584 family spore wall biosynthesis protein [Streptomyces sp. BYX5S]
MPEDVGGSPFPDGWEPDDDHDRGGWDEEFASVVFDEDFIKAAEVHEPTAVERLLAAAQARAEAQEAEARRTRIRPGPDEDFYEDPDGFGRGDDSEFGCYTDESDELYEEELDREHRSAGFAGGIRWRRPVAWALALLMGIGMVALAFTAVYRGASAGSQDEVPPPATTELEKSAPGSPSASADYSQPAVSAVPKAP